MQGNTHPEVKNNSPLKKDNSSFTVSPRYISTGVGLEKLLQRNNYDVFIHIKKRVTGLN
jgi:hypothetical protein